MHYLKIQLSVAILPLFGLITGCGDFDLSRFREQGQPERRINVEVADLNDRTIDLPPAWDDQTDPAAKSPAEEIVNPPENPPAEQTTNPIPQDNPAIPQSGELCAPCNGHQDCGGEEDFCLINSDTMEQFCGRVCNQTTGCPAGYACQAINGNNQTLYQCLPDSKSCGGGQATVDPGGEAGVCGNAYETEVLDRVNQERAKNNLKPLACDLLAGQVAHEYSQTMCDAGFFSHTGQDGSTPGSRLQTAGAQFTGAGENIAAGQPTPASVMQGWMQSSGHRSNILNPIWTHLGVGYVKCGAYDTRWTQDFLRK